MGYHDATFLVQEQHGGDPDCPQCGKQMFAYDDHGRFGCPGCGYNHSFRTGSSFEIPKIPQVTEFLPPEVDDLPDTVKEKIPPMFRLKLKPTDKEQKYLQVLMDSMLNGTGYYREKDGTIRPLTEAEQEEERKFMDGLQSNDNNI